MGTTTIGQVNLAHLGDFAAGSWTVTHSVVTAILTVFVTAMVFEHTYVKHGVVRLRYLRRPAAVLLAMALAAVVAPAPGSAQSSAQPVGLPDLISDPPFIWLERDLLDIDDNVIRVLTFDGFLHNIGDGALELAGNPQLEDGVKQLVFNGDSWEEVGSPTVRFENDDGHNHFHLINAARYTLWNEARTEQITDGSKIGFCLLDTAQIEEGFDAAYDIDGINYCNVDQPDATELRMGITPGWHDVYESSLRLQWVDVSNVSPGIYWIGAEIDPNNEIVESNEDNNDTVFSRNNFAVSGYVARTLPVQEPGDIVLKSRVYGTVGKRAFAVTEGPANGSLSVPTGFDLYDDTVTYVPNPGFTGTDSFSYYAHDTNNGFPFDPVVVTVEIQVDADAESSASADSAGTAGFGDGTVLRANDPVSASRYEPIDVAPYAGFDDATTFYASDLPPGITIDSETGALTGELTLPGDYTSTIMARRGGSEIAVEQEWSVQDARRASLRSINDLSMPRYRRDFLVGAGTAETTYSVSGLPEGMGMQEGQPNVFGAPAEAGNYTVTITEIEDGEPVDSVEFVLTVRPIAEPAFVL